MYNPPRSPSARAARRHADLMYRLRYRRRKMLHKDRKRLAVEVMRLRVKAVKDYLARCRTAGSEAEAARQSAERFEVSMSTLRRWAKAYREGGKRALIPQYHQAESKSTISFELITIILALRLRLGWCGQRIAVELEQRGIATMSHTSIYRIFRRYHVAVRTYHPVGRRDGIRYRTQHVRGPNWIWHVDFAGSWEDQNGEKRSILVVIDAQSRMLLALDVIESQSSEAVESTLTRLFERYGVPKVIHTDNGRAFVPSIQTWEHRFGAFLQSWGVEHRRSAPYYPQSNGKVEAMIKTIEREFLRLLGWKRQAIGDRAWSWEQVADRRRYFIAWYNFYRPHGALGYEVPAARYAGHRLPRRGVRLLLGWLDMEHQDLDALPYIDKTNRTERLALCTLN